MSFLEKLSEYLRASYYFCKFASAYFYQISLGTTVLDHAADGTITVTRSLDDIYSESVTARTNQGSATIKAEMVTELVFFLVFFHVLYWLLLTWTASKGRALS